MTIKEIEERSGLPRANIRYYESEGLLRPTRAANGYWDYSEEDLTTLRKVKLLREVGCSLEEVASLQAGEIDLSAVLARRQDALEKEAAVLERAKTLCAALQADKATLLNTDDGLPYDPSDDIYYTYIEPYRYSFEFADPNAPFTSGLTAVKLDIDLFSQNSVRYPGTEMACALQALEGNSALFLNPNSNLSKRCRCLRLRDPEGLKTLPEAYWHAYLDYSVSGGPASGMVRLLHLFARPEGKVRPRFEPLCVLLHLPARPAYLPPAPQVTKA